MTVPNIRLTDAPSPDDRKAISDPLVRFNAKWSGKSANFQPLAVLLTDPDTQAVIGGLWGETYFAQLFIELLFIPEQFRGSGLGSQIMRQAEAEAIRRGCVGIWLDTFSFQARGFYERLGYEVFGTIEDYPPGHSRFYLKKALHPAAATV